MYKLCDKSNATKLFFKKQRSSRPKKSHSDTYQSRARRNGCRGGRGVPYKSLIQAVVKPNIIHHRGDAIQADRLHGEPRAHHRGRNQVQMHVLPEGRETVVQRRRQWPPAARASPGHIMGQVSPLRVHLHGGHKHVVCRPTGGGWSHERDDIEHSNHSSSAAHWLYLFSVPASC